MSELNSPFLEDKEGEGNVNNDQINSEENNLRAMAYQSDSIIDNQFPGEDNNKGEIEIKDDGRVLKNVIVVLIIFLILSILGLVLYNFIFNKNKEADNVNQHLMQQMKPGIDANINNFEMNGADFKAGSIVIE